jgi:hypothetical protein
VSISLFPGAVNADLSSYAGSSWKRAKGLLGTFISFMVSGGDLEALTEDFRRDELSNARQVCSEAEHSAQRCARQNSGFSDELDSDEPPEPSKVYYRTITSLFAGTDIDNLPVVTTGDF